MTLARLLHARLLLRLAVSGYAMAEACRQFADQRLERATRLLERA